MARYYLIAASFLSLALGWDSLPVKPGRLLAVLIHEMWHGLTAMMGGVQLEMIRIHADESGETLVTGHLGMAAFLLSVSAGYVGTAWTGAALLRSGMKSVWERTTLAIFTLLLFYMTYLFTEAGSTAYLTGLLTSLLLLVLLFLGRDAAGKALVVLGSFLVFYSLFDLFDFRKNPGTTDAAILAKFLRARGWASADGFITPVSLLWSALIALGVGMSLRSGLRHSPVVGVPTEGDSADGEPLAPAPASAPGNPDPGLFSPGVIEDAGLPPSPAPCVGIPTQAVPPVSPAIPTAPAAPTDAGEEIPPGWTEAEIAEMRAMAQRVRS